MKIYYATINTGKVNALQGVFDGSNVEIIQMASQLNEPRSPNVEDVAIHKAEQAFAEIRKPIIVSDAAFRIQSLDDFPNTYVNFVLATIGLDGILRLVEGKDRTCEFVECLAYLDDSLPSPKCFVGKVRGVLSSKISIVCNSYSWSELSRVFMPTGVNQTLASMRPEQYTVWRKETKYRLSAYQEFKHWVVRSIR